MKLEVNDIVYEVEIIRKNNKNTYIRVKNGKIFVTTNYLSSDKSIKKLIDNNIDDIVKMINHDKKKMDKNDEFYYFGKKYDIVYGFSDIEITDDKIFVYDKKKLDKYINKDIVDIFSSRLDYWYHIFDEEIPVPNLKIRKMTSRWGVCNIRNHNVTLNYQLSKYDISCFLGPNTTVMV